MHDTIRTITFISEEDFHALVGRIFFFHKKLFSLFFFMRNPTLSEKYNARIALGETDEGWLSFYGITIESPTFPALAIETSEVLREFTEKYGWLGASGND